MKWLWYFLFLIAFGVSFFALPWWGFVLPSLLTGVFLFSAWRSFQIGFLLGFCMWFSIALFHDMTAGGRISARLIQIFHLPFSLLALLLTAWLAGLLAGLAATTGFYLRATLSANHMPWGK